MCLSAQTLLTDRTPLSNILGSNACRTVEPYYIQYPRGVSGQYFPACSKWSLYYCGVLIFSSNAQNRRSDSANERLSSHGLWECIAVLEWRPRKLRHIPDRRIDPAQYIK